MRTRDDPKHVQHSKREIPPAAAAAAAAEGKKHLDLREFLGEELKRLRLGIQIRQR